MAHASHNDQHSSLGIFDASHPPSLDLIRECVHCGFCLPSCPTYDLWREEADSPRGRLYLMKLGIDGAVEMTDSYVSHFDKCLGCMACLSSCPSGVQYGKLIEATRPQLERHHRRSFAERLYRRLLFSILPYPRRLRLLRLPLLIYQFLGPQWLIRRTGLLKLLPPRLQAFDDLLPPLSINGLRACVPERSGAHGLSRRRVGLLLGCVQHALSSHISKATARVLAAEGCEVIAPRSQGCCGALMLHAGREDEARLRAKLLIDTFDNYDVEIIATNAAGCGSAMKEYGYLLRDEPAYAEKAEAFSAKCKDISEVLAGLEPRAVRHPISLRVAYHDACHLQHAQNVKSEPRSLLSTIPGIDVVEVPQPAICCGSAGIYNLLEPEAARELGDRKVQNILATGADVVVTGNVGCVFQISAGLRRTGRNIPVVHTVELLDASIRGANNV